MKEIDHQKWPLVSICIPVYNRIQYIEEAVESAIMQKYPNLEIIVQDNNSTDGTWELLMALAKRYPELSIQRNGQNRGAFFNWNEVIRRSTGEYVMWLSSDDMLEPDYLARTLQVLKNNPEIGVVSTNYYFLEDGQKTLRRKQIPLGIQQDVCSKLMRNPGYFNINSTLFRRDTINKMTVKGNLITKNLMTADYDLFFRIEFAGILVYYMPEPLISYRIHGDNDSRRKKLLRKHTILILLRHRLILNLKCEWKFRLILFRYLFRISRPSEFEKRLFNVLRRRIFHF